MENIGGLIRKNPLFVLTRKSGLIGKKTCASLEIPEVPGYFDFSPTISLAFFLVIKGEEELTVGQLGKSYWCVPLDIWVVP